MLPCIMYHYVGTDRVYETHTRISYSQQRQPPEDGIRLWRDARIGHSRQPSMCYVHSRRPWILQYQGRRSTPVSGFAEPVEHYIHHRFGFQQRQIFHRERVETICTSALQSQQPLSRHRCQYRRFESVYRQGWPGHQAPLVFQRRPQGNTSSRYCELHRCATGGASAFHRWLGRVALLVGRSVRQVGRQED